MRGWKAENIAWWAFMAVTVAVSLAAFTQREAIARYLSETGRDAMLARAARLEAEGHVFEAAALYEELEARYPDREDVLVRHGLFVEKQRDRVNAEALLRRAAALGRTGSEGVAAYGDFLERFERYDDAAALYEAHVAQWPEDAEAWSRLAALALAQSRFEVALKAYDALLGLAGPSFAVLRGMGDALFGLGNKESAVAFWERSIQAVPQFVADAKDLDFPYYEIASTEWELGRRLGADTMWRKFVEQEPQSWLGLRGLLVAEGVGHALDPLHMTESRLKSLTPAILLETPLSPALMLVGLERPEKTDGAMSTVLHFANTGRQVRPVTAGIALVPKSGGDSIPLLPPVILSKRRIGASHIVPVALRPAVPGLATLRSAASPPPGEYDVVLECEGATVTLWTEVYP